MPLLVLMLVLERWRVLLHDSVKGDLSKRVNTTTAKRRRSYIWCIFFQEQAQPKQWAVAPSH